jgi:hypothetical protein
MYAIGTDQQTRLALAALDARTNNNPPLAANSRMYFSLDVGATWQEFSGPPTGSLNRDVIHVITRGD